MAGRVRIKSSRTSVLWKTGLPLILFVCGGSYALSNFTQTHVEMKDKLIQSSSTRKFDLEEEHKRLMQKLDIENYTLSRVPRPEDLDDTKTRKKK